MKKLPTILGFSFLLLCMGCTANFQNYQIKSNSKFTLTPPNEEIREAFLSEISYYSYGKENAEYLATIFDNSFDEKVKLTNHLKCKRVDLSDFAELVDDDNMLKYEVFEKIPAKYFLLNTPYKFEADATGSFSSGIAPSHTVSTPGGTMTIGGGMVLQSTATFTNGYNSTLRIYDCENKKLIGEYNLDAHTVVGRMETFNDSLFVADAAINLINDFYYLPKFKHLAEENGVIFDNFEEAEELITILVEKILTRETSEKLLVLDLYEEDDANMLNKLIDLGIILDYQVTMRYRSATRISFQISNEFFYQL